jgi:hypothetical protein
VVTPHCHVAFAHLLPSVDAISVVVSLAEAVGQGWSDHFEKAGCVCIVGVRPSKWMYQTNFSLLCPPVYSGYPPLVQFKAFEKEAPSRFIDGIPIHSLFMLILPVLVAPFG